MNPTFAIAFLRIGFGLVFLTNGIAKLTGWDGIHPFPGFLINLEGAKGILEFDVQTHPVGFYKSFIDEVVLPNFGLFGALLTLTELFVGITLLAGAFTSLGALVGAALMLHLNFANWDRNIWAWEYAVEWVPLIALAFLAAGRYWGLDNWISERLPPASRRWPFTG